MSVRPEIFNLYKISPLPSEENSTPESIRPYEELVRAIIPAIRDEEAGLLVKVFGEDDCFGLASSLVQRIETAPNWPIFELLTNIENPWIVELIRRSKRKMRSD